MGHRPNNVRDVSPRDAAPNRRDIRVTDTEPKPESRVRFWTSHYLPYLFVGKLSSLFTARESALRIAVGHVVFMRPKEQMSRIAAWRVIAVMTDKQTVRNRPIGKFPGYSVGVKGSCASSTLANHSVTSGEPRGCPWPALIRPSNVHLGPEALSKWGASDMLVSSHIDPPVIGVVRGRQRFAPLPVPSSVAPLSSRGAH